MAHRQFLKETNRSTILNVIKTWGPIARTDIAKQTGLSPAAVTGITGKLIEEGLVVEKQEGDSRGGRRPILLTLNAQGAYVVGIKLAEGHATFALTDLNASVIKRHAFALETHHPEQAAIQLADIVGELVGSMRIDKQRLLGMGIGLPGIIDTANGICRVSPFEGWHDVPFAEMLESRLDFPVYLDNDVNTLTVYEQLYGLGQQFEDFLVVTLGRGVGLGIVTDGQIYRGAGGGAGEYGHTKVEEDGALCDCGSRGCLETRVGDPWLLRHAALNGLRVDTPEALVAAAEDGNAIARDVLARAGHFFGRSLANLINLFNPALIVISGEGVRAGDYLFTSMRHAIQDSVFHPLDGDVEIRIEALTDDSWARGAASLVLGGVFHRPAAS